MQRLVLVIVMLGLIWIRLKDCVTSMCSAIVFLVQNGTFMHLLLLHYNFMCLDLRLLNMLTARNFATLALALHLVCNSRIQIYNRLDSIVGVLQFKTLFLITNQVFGKSGHWNSWHHRRVSFDAGTRWGINASFRGVCDAEGYRVVCWAGEVSLLGRIWLKLLDASESAVWVGCCNCVVIRRLYSRCMVLGCLYTRNKIV